MSDPNDNPLDDLLRNHLRRELDPAQGQAMNRLEAMLLAEQARPVSAGWKIGLRYAAAAVILLGLGVMIPILSREFKSMPTQAPTIASGTSAPRVFANAVETNWTETFDQGTMIINQDQPARVYRRVQYQKTQWQDEQGQWQSKVTTPGEDLIIIDLEKQ